MYPVCMAGHIRTAQKCRKCGRKYPKALVCPDCLTTPTRYYIDIWWHGRKRIFTDPHGFPLDSLARTEQIIATIRHQIGSGQFDPRNWVRREFRALQFQQYAGVWLERMTQERISRAYLRDIVTCAKRFFIPHFQNKSIREIRDGDILDFKRALPRHLSAKTIHNIMGILRRLFSEALTRKDILLMPTFPKLEKREPDTKFLLVGEQVAIFSHLREPYLTFYIFCAAHGVRVGEARALKWDCIDLDRGVVTIKAAMDLGTWRPYIKEGDVRHLPLNSQVRQAILALPRSLSGFVFVNRRGRPLSATRVWTAWNEAAKKAGITISPYQGTRHSFASQKLMEGYSERMVMEATGHKTLQSFRRYGKVMTETLRGMIEGKSEEFIIPMKNGKII